MVKDILKQWEHLHPFSTELHKNFREVAHDALNEIASGQMVAFPDTDQEVIEVVVNRWEDKLPQDLNLKVRLPVFPDEEI